MRFRPCIDIKDGKVKQIVGGTLKGSNATENFVSEMGADDYARMYKKDGLAGGHVIMLGPGNEEQALSALRAYPGGLQIGGGISPENAKKFLDAGASHVIVTSYVFSRGEINQGNLEKIVSAVGKNRLVLDLSCRKNGKWYYVVTDRWQNFTDYKITKANLKKLSSFCSEFLVHGVDVEGRKQGVDRTLIEVLGRYVSIPTTYAGGVGEMSDLFTIYSCGRNKLDFTIGSALDIFGGTIEYKSIAERFK